MLTETNFMIAAALLSATAIGLSLVTLLRNRRQQHLLELEAERIELLEETLAESRGLLESNCETASEHARRIAWLDAKLRRSRHVSTQKKPVSKPVSNGRTSISRNKDRVLKLAETGQDARTIAATLGLMPGEVELVLNLNSRN
ncbi:MAG: hypothetical protein HKN33_06845 [Pyrinomonadaceae bacterium]|nr:hypothetical protein [Pyrinomonadaceae bacterium]